MAARPESPGAWNATALTKFRVPRLRRDTVGRPTLLARLMQAAESCPLTLICAPGGSGKSTLLSQFALECLDGPPLKRTLLWISIDDDDNDRHQFLATLLRAVEPLELVWDTAPETLLANAERSESQCRAALAAFVNALCTARAQRVVIVLDDLHRIERADTYALIESLIERLPDHVAFLCGTRVEPPLPLARWRAHGELSEFIPWDLQFTEAEALALAQARLGDVTDPLAIRSALRRTHGWAVGFMMMLQSQATSATGTHRALTAAETSDRHLFAYLAQEVLAELPDDVRDFVLRTAVLVELSPTLCDAVTDRTDSKQVLESLYRRNLFLTITDETAPVLRFHDLFREFLQNELERRHPQLVLQLHERAGRAEPSLPRAIAHLLKAQRWDEAMELIAAHGEAMLMSGDHSALERWIDQIPEGARSSNAQMSYLRGVCAWLRWDWPRTKRELQPAIAGLAAAQFAPLRIRAMFFQVDAFSSSGEGARAWAMLEEIARQPLDLISKAQLALQRAWYVLSTGNPAGVLQYMQEFVALAEREPSLVCPQTADRIHCLCIGLPGIAECFERFFVLSELVRGKSTAPWQLAALPVGAWAQFWRGRREPVQRMIERGEALHQQFGSMRLVAERLTQFRGLYLAASGQFDMAEMIMKGLIHALLQPEAATHRAVWLRAYQHGLARFYWMSGKHEQFRELAPALLAPRVAAEWEFLDSAIELVRGQLACLREDWRVAEASLAESIRIHARFRMPMIYGDPRFNLAYVYLKQRDRTRYWAQFEPVLREVLDQDAVGLLLLEPRAAVSEMLEAVPAEVRRTAQFETLLARLAAWNPDGAGALAEATGPLAVLSEREQEVLAQVAAGASNKHIARDLSLSLHTVKRHIANILDKLDCGSRGQAADLYRRVRPVN
jgi:LuxR family transcriptional regulator, maltose regulon positive regulatory protein